MDLAYLYRALLRKKWIILFSLFFGLAIGIVVSFLQEKRYLSLAQYTTGLIQTQKVSISLSEILDENQIDSRFSNILQTFQSPKVLGMLAYDLTLHDLESSRPFRILTEKQKKDSSYRKANPEQVKKILRDKLSDMQLLSNYEPEEKKVSDLIALYKYDEYTLSKKLSIERLPHTDYINVSFVSENPELSAFIVNDIGLKFKEFYTYLTTTRTTESLNKLDSLASTKRRQVDSLRKVYEDFRAKIGTPNIGDAATAAMAGVQELTTSLTSEQSKYNTLNSQLNSVIDQLSTLNSAPAVSPTHLENYNDEILSLREKNRELTAQQAQKGGNDPAIQAKIDENTKRIVTLQSAASGSSGTSNIQKLNDKKDELQKKKLELIADISAVKQNIDLYKSRLDEFQKKAYSGGGAEATANALLSDLNAAQKDLDKYNSSILASQDLEVSPDFNFKQTLMGQPPVRPETSHRRIIVAVSGISMFFISTLLILMLEFLDTSIRTPSFFYNQTKLKLLTTIIKIDLQKKQLKDFFETNDQTDREKSSNLFIENLRKLRFELENCGKKVILITSLRPKEGKSIILESIARTLSMSKKKILIIDSNFSNNSLTKAFDAKPMLESFTLSSQENPVDKVWGVTTLTNISNTDIIGCNEGNYTPSEILPKNNLLLNISKIAQHYDFIFIEGAALNHHADSKELSKFVEGVIAVFSSKDVIREIDRESIHFLKTGAGNKFIGVILNNVNEEFIDF
ncbi:MAG TPA: Wzz/FepE/Etk N-terminal domain-containing protein [Puia sp.]|nr:Wzz/FepE/Etk N-terminal domain-containing protein [Puia sp.]